MDENSVSENISENGKVKRMIKPGLAIAAAGAAFAAGVKMRDKIDVAAFRERILPERWKSPETSITPDELDDEEE
jgi:hypothetical protein